MKFAHKQATELRQHVLNIAKDCDNKNQSHTPVQLFSCNARIKFDGNYGKIILESYATNVAVYDYIADIMYYNIAYYRYSNTTNKHIREFVRLFNPTLEYWVHNSNFYTVAHGEPLHWYQSVKYENLVFSKYSKHVLPVMYFAHTPQ